jgi:hypothetical protein
MRHREVRPWKWMKRDVRFPIFTHGSAMAFQRARFASDGRNPVPAPGPESSFFLLESLAILTNQAPNFISQMGRIS